MKFENTYLHFSAIICETVFGRGNFGQLCCFMQNKNQTLKLNLCVFKPRLNFVCLQCLPFVFENGERDDWCIIVYCLVYLVSETKTMRPKQNHPNWWKTAL